MELLLVGGNPEQGGFETLIMLGLIMVVFYFFMIRPQVKKQKAERKFRENIEKGDKVLTVGGIHGKVVETKDTAVILEVAANVQIKVEKSALSQDSSKILGANNK